ncbi:MAG: rhodanese-like domain-containing protein [Crocinitomicaceae bacterium]|nr:rhodanese-like domain-containing protein [Crocinitomicaceae bacterium]MDG1659243.1 rhodanese-like domain-containing protein [Crocinitomicaceae bacterium]
MKHLFFILLFILSHQSFGQVQSRSYSDMLYKLLDHSVDEISVSEASELGGSTLFLDAREKKEYDVSHINGAKWVGYDNFKMKRMSGVPKNKEIVIYCSVGYRSEKIAERLEKSGYTNVKNLYGSIFEWVNQGHPVYNNSGKKTMKVHAYDKEWGQWLRKGQKVY